MRKVDFVVAVWGDAYVDTMLAAGLPSFLASGNLPAAAQLAEIRFTVVTRPEDSHRIERHPAWQALSALCEARILPLLHQEVFADRNRYDVMALSHREIIADCLERGSVLSVLSPDCIVSDGSLGAGVRSILNGAQTVLVAGPRATLEPVIPELARYRDSSDGIALRIPSGDLVSFVCRWPHPISSLLFWESQPFSQFPSAVYWPAGKESFLARYFHLHPLFVDLSDADPGAANSGTVDGSLVSLARISPDRVHVVERSREICVVELSRIDHDPMGSLPVEVSDKTQFIRQWAQAYADSSHVQQFLRHAFMFEGNETIDWAAEKAHVARLTENLDQALRDLEADRATTQATPAFSRFIGKIRDALLLR